ncbi:hypothetical protein [Luteibacter sp. ME-Dv--P-043b]|uniref:hypothetical protein n=1 Tax=Luteibacter sp. ME-Dv--P-043b TaxID=3040291 RepID=UPI002556F85C|nr:hypothetical protein [Luteibacter sp. ME-Dv--P-043b]
MGKRREERARREEEQRIKFEESKKKILARMNVEQEPKIVVRTAFVSVPRVASGHDLASDTPRTASVIPVAVTPKAPAADTFSRHQERMTWCITASDKVGEWSWGEPRKWADGEWKETIYPGMEMLAPLTWGEIESLNSGGSHRMHHEQDLGSIAPEAIQRWHEIGLGQFDTLFRFRIGGQKSHAWGYILQTHFFFVWWERLHKIYVSAEKDKDRQKRKKDRKKRENEKKLADAKAKKRR